jgi:hypothetical protein
MCHHRPRRRTEGPPKKSTDPPVHLLNPRPTHPPADFFCLDFRFLVRFWAFLGEGSSKTPHKYLQKVQLSKTFSKKIDKNFDVSFSSIFFVLSRFRVFLSDGSSKTQQKTFCERNLVKTIYQKIDKKPKIDFLSIFFYHVFGRFSVRGVQSSKTPQKTSKC